ncbi:MAG: SatD family protein [Dehalococcoidales bacterium]|nr:SatD family protein [Dehalococcoidales bacterium]
MNTHVFTVISGDLVRSRDISQRDAFSEKLSETLKDVNREFHDEIFAPLTVTKGIDEISAVLKKPELSYRICRSLNERIHPHSFRFAIVTGTLDVAIEAHDARQMDGKAFHTASGLLLAGKKKDGLYFFKVSGSVTEMDSLLEELALLIHIIRQNWTSRQYRIIQLYSELGNQFEVANRLKITQQAVSDSLKKSHFQDLKRAEESIEAMLKTDLINKLNSL